MIKSDILKNSGLLNESDDLLYESLTEAELEVIEEGLRVFKKSKQLLRYADKLEKTMMRRSDRGKPEHARVLKGMIQNIRNLAKKYDLVEQDFAKKKISRAEAKAKLKTLKIENQGILAKLKSAQVKKALKIFGIVALGASIGGLIASAGSTIMSMLGVETIKSASSFYPVASMGRSFI